MATFLKRLDLTHVLARAGVNARAALGGRQPPAASAWLLCTPIGAKGADLSASRFYRSIDEFVDDPEKKSHFAVLINAVFRASVQPNYQDVLKGSNVTVKVAHGFKYAGKQHKIWELKSGKKDRVYFITCEVCVGGKNLNLIVLLLAYHKKDQTTPEEVSRYAEQVMREFICPKPDVELAKE